MRRRKLIQRIGAASTLALGASGLASAADDGVDADRLTHAQVRNAQGELETVQMSELVQRGDLPAPDELSVQGSDVGTESCCCEDCLDECLCCGC